MTCQSVYLYGFTRAGAVLPAELPGIDGGAPTLVPNGAGVAAVVNWVDASTFQGAEAEARVQDPSWLVPRACRHQGVLEAVLAAGPVLPVRFGAVFSSAAALADYMRLHGSIISEFLDRVADQEEWAVKGLLDVARAQEWLLEADPDLLASRLRLPQSPGVRYLQERRLRAEARKRLEPWRRDTVARIEGALRDLTPEVRPLRLRSSSGAPEMVLNLALLLPHGAVARFREEVQALAERHASAGLVLECTGPWPPFNFCPALGERSS